MTRQHRYPRWMRRAAAALLVPFTLLATDWSTPAWAYRRDRGANDRIVAAAKAQGLDPEALLDPVSYQKKEAERANVRRTRAVAEVERLGAPDAALLAAAERERDAVKRAYASSEVAAVGKDVEGLRQALRDLGATSDRRRQEGALHALDGYARGLGDAAEALARFDAAERGRLATLPSLARQRHEQFMRSTLPVLRAVEDELGVIANARDANRYAAVARTTAALARLAPAPSRTVDPARPFATRPVTFRATPPRTDSSEFLRVAPNAQSPRQFEREQELLRRGPAGARGIPLLPGYLLALLAGPGLSDLAATDEAPASPDILAQAAALGHDPIRIYDFVHDTLVNEVYYGSKKGARGTLAEGAGNDFDQASLLVALLRASSIPARYEAGTVVLTPDQAMAFTGAETPAAAASALVSSGFPARELASGNTITGIEMELVWVRAWVPYADYRGTDVTGNPGDRVWAHLAPSIKRYRLVSPVNLVGKVPFDFNAFLSKEQSKSPVNTWEDQVRQYVVSHGLDCTTLDGAEKLRLPIADRLPLLPETLPVQVAARLAVFSTVPAALQHSVAITGQSATGVAEVDYQSTVAALYGKALSVQFEPATGADAATLAAHGGLESTPAYLVKLVPVLYAGDTALAAGAAGDTPGLDQHWQVRFTIPNLAEDEPSRHLFAVGGVYALVTDPGTLPGSLIDDAQATEQAYIDFARPAEMVAAAKLTHLGRLYMASVDRAVARVNGLYWTRYFKDTYEGSFGLTVRVQSLGGVPVSVKRNLIDVDVARLVTTPFAIDGNNTNSPTITRLAGYEGSYLEHSTPQGFYGPNQWSAIRLLQNASQNGQTLFDIDSTNVDAMLTRISPPDSVATDIRNQVNRGRAVKIHSLAVSPPTLIPLWGYIAADPATGAADYRINATLDGDFGSQESIDRLKRDNPVCTECKPPGGASSVDAASGSFFFDETDFMIPAVTQIIRFQRIYRSNSQQLRTSLGPGWQSNFDARLLPQGDGSVLYLDETGISWGFAATGTSDFTPPPGLHRSLVQQGDGSYIMVGTTRYVTRFDVSGRMISQTDPNGHVVTFSRNGGGNLVAVVDASGRTVFTFTYDGSGNLASVQDPANRIVSFSHDAAGHLIGQTDPLGASKSYGYDAEDRLITKTNYRGDVFSIAYDDEGRWRRTTNPLGETRSAAYDANNRTTVVTDPLGNQTTYRFDAGGARASETDPLGNTVSIARDADLNPVQQIGPRGEVTSATYDENGNGLTLTDPLGATTVHTFNALGLLASRTDALGNKTSNAYDAGGNLVTTTDPTGQRRSIQYSNGMMTAITGADGATLGMSYDAQGNRTAITKPIGGKISLSYDTAGHLSTVVDANGGTWRLGVDAKDRLRSFTDPTGGVLKLDFDADGHRTAMTDPLGNANHYTYDALGRPTSTTDAAGNTWRTEYDAAGRIVAETDPRGATTRNRYDALGRLAARIDPYGNETTYAYCAALPGATTPGGPLGSGPCNIVDALGNVTKIDYDVLGRPIGVTDPSGARSTVTYDAAGRRTAMVDAAGHPTQFVYDGAGRLSEVIDALGGITAHQYDGAGRPVALIDANGHETDYTYDAAGELIAERTPLGTTVQYGYDALGNRISKTDGDGSVTRYTYNGVQDLVTITAADGGITTYTYDAAHRPLTESNGDISRQMTYDALGRLTSVVDLRLNKTLTYQYDAAGNRTKMSLSDGDETDYVWDLNGRLRELRDPEQQTTRFAVDAAGRRTAVVYPNGVAGSFLYDALSRPSTIAWRDPRGQLLESFSYRYDALGNPATKTFADATSEEYSYDVLSRLVGAAYPSGRQVNYTLDPVGNRLKAIETGGTNPGTTNLTYNAFDQLTQRVAPGGATTNLKYDARGSLIERDDPNGTTGYTYDGRNRLTQVTLPGGLINRYGYDPEGLRVHAEDSAGARNVLLDGREEYAEFDAGSQARMARYDHDPSGIDRLLAQVTGQGKHHALGDALGNVVGLVDSAGVQRARYQYDAFGARTAALEQATTPWGFTGRKHERDRSQVYFRDRYYMPDTGIFASRDLLERGEIASHLGSIRPDLQSLVQLWGSQIERPTPYRYAQSNPLTGIDPFGLGTFSLGLSITAGGGFGPGGANFNGALDADVGAGGSGWSFGIDFTLGVPVAIQFGFALGVGISLLFTGLDSVCDLSAWFIVFQVDFGISLGIVLGNSGHGPNLNAQFGGIAIGLALGIGLAGPPSFRIGLYLTYTWFLLKFGYGCCYE